MKTKVFAKLKPKAASLGFTKDELEGIAADIAGNLNSEDATDEDIDARIDAALPFLKVAQKAVNRTIEEARKKATQNPIETDPAKDDKSGSDSPQNDEPAWFKTYRETQDKRLQSIEAKETGKARRDQLEDALKGSNDAFKAKALKDFSRMNFESDDAFVEYLEETKQDVTVFTQSEANEGLASSHVPSGGGSTKEEPEKIAALIGAGTKEIINNSKN